MATYHNEKFTEDKPGSSVVTIEPSAHYASFSATNQVGPDISQPNTLVVNTTNVVTKPPARAWRANLCNCFADCSVCCCVYWCGPCYACALSRRMNESCCVGMCPGGMSNVRTKLRMTHNIEGSLLGDICSGMCCGPCLLCQMGNEMNRENYPKACCGC